MKKSIIRRGETFISNNPKTTLFSCIGSLTVMAASCVGSFVLYQKNRKADAKLARVKAELANERKRVETDNDIRKVSAQTACRMLENAANIAPEVSNLKAEILGTKDEMKEVKEKLEKAYKYISNNSTLESVTSSDIDCQGRSSSEFFNRPREENSKWVVDGYMKIGQVNLVVAGSGVGKTIFMVQIALAVSKGIRPEFLPNECCESVKLKVFYYCLENFSGEFEGKYGECKVFYDTSITWFGPDNLPTFNLVGLIEHMKELAGKLTEDTLVCIDPATKLDGYKHTEFVKGLEEAIAIAKSRNIIMTPVATIHLDEIKDWTVLTNCDIKGGDKGLQQAGSVTALRRERTDVEEYRFLQSLKEPKGSPKPFNGNVLVMKQVQEQLEGNNKYLHYEFVSTKREEMARPEKPKTQVDALKECSDNITSPKAPNQKVTPLIEQQIKDMLSEGKKPSKITKSLKLSERTIRRYKNGF